MIELVAESIGAVAGEDLLLPIHVVLVTNFIAAHRLPLYQELSKLVGRLTILLSTKMEADRRWQPQWDGLDVRLQKSFSLRMKYPHALGFPDATYVHIPWDTIFWLRRLKPDVIVSAELGFRTACSAAYARATGTPLVYILGMSEHTEDRSGLLRRTVRKCLLPCADTYLINGNSGVRYLQAMGCQRQRIHRLHYSALPGVFDNCPLSRNEDCGHRLLYVGRLVERKGILPLMAAVARWGRRNPRRNVQLDVAGDGPLQGRVEAYDLPANVRLQILGHCDYAQLSECYSRAGILAFPSFADDWGISVLEGMTAGLPVLGSIYSQCVDELCIEGETGWRFRTDCDDELDRALSAALDTPHERLEQMRAAARLQVADFTPQQGARDLVGAIDAALRRRKLRTRLQPVHSLEGNAR
jgi:glycosyltransferase involved in cell wall biosynthesis